MRHAQRALECHQDDPSMAQRQRCMDGLQPHENRSWWRLGGISHALVPQYPPRTYYDAPVIACMGACAKRILRDPWPLTRTPWGWRLSQEVRSERAINPIPPTNRTSISNVLNKLVGRK